MRTLYIVLYENNEKKITFDSIRLFTPFAIPCMHLFVHSSTFDECVCALTVVTKC